MRVISGFFVMMGLVLVLSVGAAGQVCGDIDGKGYTDITDLSLLCDYGAGNVYGGQNYSVAELDGRTNISFSDLTELCGFLFYDFHALTCDPPTLEYSFSPSLADTLYIPRILSIPATVQRVGLPVITVCGDSTGGVCLPLVVLGSGSTANFHYQEFEEIAGNDVYTLGGWVSHNPDSSMLYFLPDRGKSLAGRHTIGILWYQRTAAGPATIIPQPFDRHPMWRVSVENQKDLNIPVVSYYDYVIPPDTMVVTPTTTSLTTYAHRLSKDSVAITYTSSPNPVNFTLNASESWVVYPTGTLTTPVTVYLRANADSLSAGAYAATLNVNSTDPNTAIVPGPTAITLTVLPPIDFPIGDFDCSGNIDINDLTILIIHMFLGGPAPEPCY